MEGLLQLMEWDGEASDGWEEEVKKDLEHIRLRVVYMQEVLRLANDKQKLLEQSHRLHTSGAFWANAVAYFREMMLLVEQHKRWIQAQLQKTSHSGIHCNQDHAKSMEKLLTFAFPPWQTLPTCQPMDVEPLLQYVQDLQGIVDQRLDHAKRFTTL